MRKSRTRAHPPPAIYVDISRRTFALILLVTACAGAVCGYRVADPFFGRTQADATRTVPIDPGVPRDLEELVGDVHALLAALEHDPHDRAVWSDVLRVAEHQVVAEVADAKLVSALLASLHTLDPPPGMRAGVSALRRQLVRRLRLPTR